MSKVPDELKVDRYESESYLTVTELFAYYGYTTIQSIEALPNEVKIKFQDWTDNANRTVESALYKYNDQIPIDTNSESYTFAKSMALHWAQYEKAADEGAPNAKAKETLWKMDKEHLLETMKAQPQKTTTRVVTSSRFEDSSYPPYSQTYGVRDLL